MLYTHVVAILTSSLIILLYLFERYSVKSPPALLVIGRGEGSNLNCDLLQTHAYTELINLGGLT